MLDRNLHNIYVMDLKLILIVIPILVLIWSFVAVLLHRKMRVIGIAGVILSLTVILYVTIFSRNTGNFEYDLIPLSSFHRAVEQPETYRSMLMNVFLFVPLGMSLVYVLGDKSSRRILLTVMIGFLLSVSVEVTQYIFSLGMAETDDVICNTLGTLIGSCAYPLSLLWCRIFKKLRKGKTYG